MTTNFTGYIDLAQVVLYVFFGFFAALVYYLHSEGKREGYPLESDRSGAITVQGFPPVPDPKAYLLADGTKRYAPRAEPQDLRVVNGVPAENFPGAPLVPNGDPMTAGIGPGSYAEREDVPDLTMHGTPKIVPLRLAEGFYLDHRDPNPIGMDVLGADGEVGGIVRDVWVDRGEYILRYMEVEVGEKNRKRNVLLPVNFTRVSDKGYVTVQSILGRHFAAVPSHRKPDMVTRLEEEKIMAYYGAGTLYATPDRAEPLL
jgi:photosynthetic reaction center H subunit